MPIGVPTQLQAISNTIASYNFTDIVAGTGYVILYAGRTYNDVYLLSNFTYYTDNGTNVNPGGNSHNAAYTKIMDLDFDVLLNKPLDVSGLGIFNIPFNVVTNAAGYGYAVLKLRKWDGVTETEIANATTREVAGAGGVGTYVMLAVNMTIPLTHYKKGEYLRLTVETYEKVNGGANVMASVGIDPKNRTTGWDTTGAVPSQFSFQCPVRLNL